MDKPQGIIRRDCCYTLPAFCRELGIGRHGWRSLKRDGLRVRSVGKRVLILGEDFFRWLDRQNREQ